MKKWIRILIYALIGFIVGYGSMLFRDYPIDLLTFADESIIIILVITVLLMGWGTLLYKQIQKLSQSQLQGDDEDEADVIIYRKFSDYSLIGQVSFILSILALCMSVITGQGIYYIIASIVMMLSSFIFMMLFRNIMQFVYPDRPLPSTSEPNYSEKLLEIADDGEKHVILHGLYKTYNLLTALVIFGILLSTFYSVASGTSQLFSIILMCMILIAIQGRYIFAIRNK